MATKEVNMPDLTIKFDNEKTLIHFMNFMCSQGEQVYWEWMAYQNDDDVTAKRFTYHREEKFIDAKNS